MTDADASPNMSRYRVLVDDHFNYQDESARWEAGTFETAAEAIDACCEIVERDLRSMFREGMSADQLFEIYGRFGDDPFITTIVEHAPPTKFDAWSFAESLSRTIVDEPARPA